MVNLSERVTIGPSGRDFWLDLPAQPPAGAQRGDLHWIRRRDQVPIGAEGWTLIYVTEGVGGALSYASGELYLPQAVSTHASDVVLWNHPTAGMTDACAPSWGGDPSRTSPFGFERVPSIAELLEQGYGVVMSDYQGLGTPGGAAYMDGALAAKASIDVVRAANNVSRGRLGRRFVAYGHSQGGQVTLWVAALASSYAPEMDLRGAVAIAPAVDTLALVQWDIANPPLGAYVVTTAAGLKVSHPYLRLRDILTPAGLELLATMAHGCHSTRSAAESVAEPMVRVEGLEPGEPWRRVFDSNGDFYRHGLNVPTLVIQGSEDFDVPAHITRGVVERMKLVGMRVDYRELPDRNHFDVVPAAMGFAQSWFSACLNP